MGMNSNLPFSPHAVFLPEEGEHHDVVNHKVELNGRWLVLGPNVRRSSVQISRKMILIQSESAIAIMPPSAEDQVLKRLQLRLSVFFRSHHARPPIYVVTG